MECRINAEDVYANFRPSPGKILELHKPGGHGVRIDSHIYSGYSIPPYYDSMIAKVIVSAQTREECIVKMRRALQEFHIEGIKTTIPLHLQLLDDKDFQSGNFTTAFMDTFKIK
jgi:acetyl-CoA carboxylase, biotin carboxylase subunit